MAKKKTTAAKSVASKDVSMGVKVDAGILWDVRELANRLGREKAKRVTIKQLTEEAYRDLLAKYRRR